MKRKNLFLIVLTVLISAAMCSIGLAQTLPATAVPDALSAPPAGDVSTTVEKRNVKKSKKHRHGIKGQHHYRNKKGHKKGYKKGHHKPMKPAGKSVEKAEEAVDGAAQPTVNN